MPYNGKEKDISLVMIDTTNRNNKHSP